MIERGLWSIQNTAWFVLRGFEGLYFLISFYVPILFFHQYSIQLLYRDEAGSSSNASRGTLFSSCWAICGDDYEIRRLGARGIPRYEGLEYLIRHEELCRGGYYRGRGKSEIYENFSGECEQSYATVPARHREWDCCAYLDLLQLLERLAGDKKEMTGGDVTAGILPVAGIFWINCTPGGGTRFICFWQWIIWQNTHSEI